MEQGYFDVDEYIETQARNGNEGETLSFEPSEDPED
jgi:hypothetical protein